MKFPLKKIGFVSLFLLFFTTNIFAQLNADFTVVDADGCSPLLATFNNATTGTVNPVYSWDFGDGGTSSIPNPQHNYALPGTFTVTLIVTDGANSDTEVKTGFITVFANPTADYSVNKDTACAGTPVLYSDASIQGDGAINQWDWTFNDGSPTISGVNTLNHNFVNSTGQPIIYVPVLIVTDINGCNSIFSNDSIYIYPLATASFAVGATSSCTLPATINFNNTSTGPSIYQWDFGDPSSGGSNTSTLFQPSHIYASGGSFLVTLTNGVSPCITQDTMTIYIAPPNASFSIVDTIVCRGDSAYFINNSTPASATFQWTFGDGSPSSFAKTPSHRYLNPGIFPVTLTARVGTCTSTQTKTVYVPPLPSIAFSSPDRVSCSIPFLVNFNGDTTSQNVAWQWNFGDPGSGSLDTAIIRNPSHNYTAFGDYTVSLKVTDIFGCSDTVQILNYVKVSEPQVDFTITDSGCVNDIFTFNAAVNSPADTSITNYSWDFGDGPAQSTATPGTTHQYSTPGIYDVSLTITTSSGCTATKSYQGFIKVGTKPIAEIDSVPSTICFKGNVTFNDLSTPPVTGWLWYFGDGGSSTLQSPNHQYNIDTSKTNPFDIILIAFYNGCPDTDTVVQMITVNSPLPDFVPQYNCINPDSVKFTNLTGGGTSDSWDFGDASPADLTFEPSHIYAGPGLYSVKLTATNSATGCIVDTTLQVSIKNLNTVLQRDTAVICGPGTINFVGSNSVDAASYTWYFGEGVPGVKDTSITADTLHLYTRPGFYTVKLMTTDIHSCIDKDSIQVHIVGPTSGFTANPFTGCTSLFTHFTDTSKTEGSNIVQWNWTFGNGIPPITTLVDTTSHTYTTPGSYSVTLKVTDANGCTDTHTSFNYIKATSPIASIILPDTFGCRNTPELITGNAGVPGTFATPVTYQWNFGDSQTFTDTSNTVNHTYTANGTYTISLTVTDANGCSSSKTKNIFVYTTSAHFSVTKSDLCADEHGIKKAVITGLFSSDSNFYVSQASYYWNLYVNNPSQTTNSIFQYTYNVAPGNYDATLILTNNFGCKDTFTILAAVVIPGPTGSFTFSPDSGCTPLTVNFSGISTNSTLYAWDFGDGFALNDTNVLNVTHVYDKPKTYNPQFYLGFQLSNSFCYIPAPHPDSLKVTSGINVDILESVLSIKEGEQDTLHVAVSNGTPPYTYIWNPSDQVISTQTGGTFLASPIADSVYYTVSIPYGTPGCAGVDKVLIRLIPNICEVRWDSIPNVFTPNGDSKNDFFHIKDLCEFDGFFIKIFNRWGRIVYESTDPDFRWPGTTTGGTEVSEGVYYYVLHAKTRDWHGYIDLIRDEK